MADQKTSEWVLKVLDKHEKEYNNTSETSSTHKFKEKFDKVRTEWKQMHEPPQNNLRQNLP